MIIPILLLIFSACVAVALFRLVAQKRESHTTELTRKKKELEAKYDFMLGKKWELQAEKSRKKKALETITNNQDGIRINANSRMSISQDDEEDKISTYLLASGQISLEQDHNIKQKKTLLKMDYLSTGVTLGYIDLKVSQKLSKGNWAIQ